MIPVAVLQVAQRDFTPVRVSLYIFKINRCAHKKITPIITQGCSGSTRGMAKVTKLDTSDNKRGN